MYPYVRGSGSSWLYLDNLGWTWTAPDVYPWLYNVAENDWIGYAEGSGINGGTCWYWSITTGEWFYMGEE